MRYSLRQLLLFVTVVAIVIWIMCGGVSKLRYQIYLYQFQGIKTYTASYSEDSLVVDIDRSMIPLTDHPSSQIWAFPQTTLVYMGYVEYSNTVQICTRIPLQAIGAKADTEGLYHFCSTALPHRTPCPYGDIILKSDDEGGPNLGILHVLKIESDKDRTITYAFTPAEHLSH